MKRGVFFELSNEYGKYLFDILQSIPLESYNWHIGYEEILMVDRVNETLFEDYEEIEGDELRRIIDSNTYYAIFAELKAFPKTSTITEIDTYEDFVSSDCEVIVLLVDCVYVEMYIKNQEVLETMYKHAKQMNYTRVEYIDDKNDGRTRMYVW